MKTGISLVSITKIERNGHVTTEILLKICTALSCQVENIMENGSDDKVKYKCDWGVSLMKAVSNTGKSGVLVLKIDEDDVNTVLINTDVSSDGSFQYAYDNFATVFSESILEYAFAYAAIPRDQITRKQREAAQSLLKLYEVEKLRTCIHKRLSRVWKWEIMTIVSAEETEIS